jgi:hypothetical protein
VVELSGFSWKMKTYASHVQLLLLGCYTAWFTWHFMLKRRVCMCARACVPALSVFGSFGICISQDLGALNQYLKLRVYNEFQIV